MKRMFTHVSGILLCFAMLLALTMAVSAASCETHDFQNGFCSVCGSYQYAPLRDGYHEIRNAGQLYWFAAKVNKGQTDLCAKLVADITVNDQVLAEDGTLAGSGDGLRKWKPAGDADAPYVGTFDGNGKTISGLYLDDPKQDYAGLFGQIGPEGVVKGVTLTDSWIRIWLEAKDEIACGGIAGQNYGTIQDCHNGASVSNNESYVGGIAGYNASGASIIGCTNTGKLSGNELVGGIAAQSMGLLKDCINYGPVSATMNRCGGITGSFGSFFGDGSSLVENCHNLGSVESTSYIGGIVGEIAGSGAEIRRCSNVGAVTGNGRVGGVAGDVWGDTTVSECFNSGPVTGEWNTGGLCGGLNNGLLIRCFNTGVVTGGGGLIGWSQAEPEEGEPEVSQYAHCYYLAGTASCDVWEDEPQQAVFARSAAFFSSGALAWALNEGVTDGTQAWYQDLGEDEMPGFSGGTVYRLTEPCGTFSNKAGTVQKKSHMSGSYVCTQGVYCTDCDDLLGHGYQPDVVAPTCEKQGYTAYTCEHCGHCYLGDYTDPEHQYEDGFCVGCGKLEVPQILSCYSKVATYVKVTWSRVSAANGYQLFQLDTGDPDAGWKQIKTIKSNDTTSYTNQGLTPGRTYRYKVRAWVDLDDGERIWSDFSQEEYMPGAALFDGPYSNSSSRIRLRWKWMDGVNGYQIWRKTQDGTYRVVKTVNDGDATAYSNTGLTAGEKYTYKIRAFRITDSGKKMYGAYSEEVTVAVQPDVPEFTAVSTKSGRVKLQWEQMDGATGYQIWISEKADGAYNITKTITSGDTVSYTKNGLEPGKTYYFKLRAFIEIDGKKVFGAYTTTVAVKVKS